MFHDVISYTEEDMMLGVLGLVDMSMVANLVYMVVVGGYTMFISTIDIEEHPEPPAYYVQLPERRIWAHTVTGNPPEPLDGCFVHASSGGRSLRVLGVFGLHGERAGFTVVEVAGIRPVALIRPDGSELFSPTLAGGAAARLFSLAGGEELLELGWRTRTLLVPSSAEVSRWRA